MTFNKSIISISVIGAIGQRVLLKVCVACASCSAKLGQLPSAGRAEEVLWPDAETPGSMIAVPVRLALLALRGAVAWGLVAVPVRLALALGGAVALGLVAVPVPLALGGAVAPESMEEMLLNNGGTPNSLLGALTLDRAVAFMGSMLFENCNDSG